MYFNAHWRRQKTYLTFLKSRVSVGLKILQSTLEKRVRDSKRGFDQFLWELRFYLSLQGMAEALTYIMHIGLLFSDIHGALWKAIFVIAVVKHEQLSLHKAWSTRIVLDEFFLFGSWNYKLLFSIQIIRYIVALLFLIDFRPTRR